MTRHYCKHGTKVDEYCPKCPTVDPAVRQLVEAEVEAAAEAIRRIPWCTPAMATNADHIARAVLESVFDLPKPPFVVRRVRSLHDGLGVLLDDVGDQESDA
jgi:hypothetical protein